MYEKLNLKKNFWTFFIDNYKLTFVFLIAIVLFGFFSIATTTRESSPEIDIPIIVVTTFLPGASAIDVEELVTNEIESKIQGLEDIDSVTSVSSQGFSQIVVNFDIDSDGREKVTDVRERVDRAKPDLPSDAEDPTIQQVSFSDTPILTMALTGPYDTLQLKSYAEDLETEIEKISGVSEVNIVGAPARQIEVVIQEESLSQYGLELSQITNGIASANSDIPIGSIESSGSVYTVKLDGRLQNVEDVLDTAIANQEGVPIFIRDVAVVNDTFARSGTISRLSADGGDSRDSVKLQVFKTSGTGDILSIVDEVSELVSNAETILPEGAFVEIIENEAKLIRADLSNLLTSGSMTVVIVLLVLILFLGWKEALLASMVVPLTFLITFIFLNPLGYTINFLTLFSLILALGILVDASIVVTENIFSMLEKGNTPYESALLTIKEFQKPLISGTLTTVFVFLPMLLMTGIMGKFIESIPITITIVLMAAIFISLAIIPTLAVRFLKPIKNAEEHGFIFIKKAIRKTYKWYAGKLYKLIQSPKAGKKLLWTIGIAFFVSIALPVVGIVKVNMFPSASLDVIYIDVTNPTGTPLEVTNAQLEDVEAVIVEDERIESFLVTAGSGSNVGSLNLSQSSGNKGSIVVNLRDDNEISSLDIIEEYKKTFEGFSDADIVVSQLSSGPESGKPVQVRVVGDNIEDIKIVASDVAGILEKIDGVTDADSGIEESNGELLVSVNRAQARSFGVAPIQIASILRTAISGDTATVIKNNGEDLDVIIRYDIGSDFPSVGSVPRVTPTVLNSILVPTNKGLVPLATFADIKLSSSLSSIAHDDSDRVITVSSGINEGANAGVIVKQLQKQLESYELPEGVSFSYGGEAEDIAESFASLGKAMVLGIFLIFGLLLWQFNSYRQPLFVLVTIPLALIGVLPGLAISNQPLSFPGFIGVVALAGIVVNNAIILIDSINASRAAGLSIFDAVYESAQSRLQPILLTTITTVAGMIPLALSDPTWAPLALSIIFGLMFSTVLTLFVIPVLYTKFGEKELEVIE